MYKLKSGIAYITAAAVIVALWVYWISNRVSVSVIVPVYNSEKFFRPQSVRNFSNTIYCGRAFSRKATVFETQSHKP